MANLQPHDYLEVDGTVDAGAVRNHLLRIAFSWGIHAISLAAEVPSWLLNSVIRGDPRRIEKRFAERILALPLRRPA